jgi:hypothetical protein
MLNRRRKILENIPAERTIHVMLNNSSMSLDHDHRDMHRNLSVGTSSGKEIFSRDFFSLRGC